MTEEYLLPSQQEGNIAAEWINYVRTSGKGFLYGKFKSVWFDPNAKSVPEIPTEVPMGSDAAFREMGAFGFKHAQGTVNISAIPNRRLTVELDIVTPVNYLIVSRPLNSRMFEDLGMHPDQNWRAFTYCMLQHWKKSPIGGFRGAHHLPHEFYFFLPGNLSDKFATDILAHPHLIEDIYTGMYPGLQDRGLQRVQSKVLRLYQLPTNDMTPREVQSVVSNPRSFHEIALDAVVGEVPA